MSKRNTLSIKGIALNKLSAVKFDIGQAKTCLENVCTAQKN